MINNGSVKRFEEVRAGLLTSACAVILATSMSGQLSSSAAPTTKAPEKKVEKSPSKGDHKNETKPDLVVENVQSVTTDQLVDKPHDFLNKNIKFDANFHAFSSIALDYKPAMRASKDHLSFLVLRPNSKIPFSELKLAMVMPKEKDPDNTMLAALKEGDELEITGHVFATALDEPWVDVLKVKKIASAPEKKEDDQDKKAEKATGEKNPEKDKSKDLIHSTPDVKMKLPVDKAPDTDKDKESK
jgi:hypothetical protein